LLIHLGLSDDADLVYRTMLIEPTWGVGDLSAHLGLTERVVRRALDQLADLCLLDVTEDGQPPRVADPSSRLSALLSKAEESVREQQRQIQAARDTVTAITTAYERRNEATEGVRWEGVEAVRTRLRQLSETAKRECWSFTPGGAHRPDAMSASRGVNQAAIERGVQVLCIYQTAYRNDADTVAYADWLTGMGGEIRTVPTVPMQLVIVDREVVLLPINPTSPQHGAIEVHTPAIVAAMCALFAHVWDVAMPMSDRSAPAGSDDANGQLSAFEQAVLRLLANGLTDESASRRLGVSVRTLRRTISEITTQLHSSSRFQAGVEANRRGWV
jgi:DNA-binding CsgD family transcriptional regulator